jgi:hydroxyacylglutathione hydrolase
MSHSGILIHQDSVPARDFIPLIQVHPVPAFSDNYLWVMHDGLTAVAVDPGDARPVIDYLVANNLVLEAILCTHHHADHVGGVDDLLDFFELRDRIPVYGPATEVIPSRTVALREGDHVGFPSLNLLFDVLDVPGHTAGHIAYASDGVLFCGDTLFACGCGRLFEGTAAQMTDSISKLRALPTDTKVYCAHEYTMSNIRFAEAVEPGNVALKARKAQCAAMRERGEPTIPTTIGVELAVNPFMRWDQPDVIRAASQHAGRVVAAAADVFAVIREWKNRF